MSNIKKVGLLIGLLASPALIFLYLVTFTTNHYDLPYFFPLVDENTKEYQMQGSDTVYYQIDRSAFISGNKEANCNVSVVSILPEDCDENCQRQIMNFSSLKDVLNAFPGNCLAVYYYGALQETLAERNISKGYEMDSVNRADILHTFKLDTEEAKGAETILIDQQGRIRGFFELSNSKDLDRLFAEIKILNHNLANND